MDKITALHLCGAYNLGLAVFHAMFWKLFHWKSDLQRINFANRAIIQILNVRLIYVFLLMAFVYFFCAHQLMETKLGYVLLFGFFGFWVGRSLEQFIFLNVKSRVVSLLTFVFALGAILHALPLIIR